MYDTKYHFAETFLRLLENYSIDEISISQLCKESNYSRKAFYYHFEDKYDLIRWIHYYQKSFFFSNYYLNEPWDQVADRILHEMKRTCTFYKRGFEDNSYNNLEKSMLEQTSNMYTEMVKHTLKTDDLPENLKIVIKYNANGTVLIVKEWIMSNFKVSIDVIKEALTSSMSEDLKQILVYKNVPDDQQKNTKDLSTLQS